MKFDNCISKGKLKSVYLKDGKAIKVFDKKYNKSDVLYEALNTSRVEDAKADVPKLLSVDVIDGQWCITSEYVEGSTLAELMKAHPKKMDTYLQQMVDLQLSIHSKRNPLMIRLKDKLIRQINDLDCIDSTKNMRFSQGLTECMNIQSFATATFLLRISLLPSPASLLP